MIIHMNREKCEKKKLKKEKPIDINAIQIGIEQNELKIHCQVTC